MANANQANLELENRRAEAIVRVEQSELRALEILKERNRLLGIETSPETQEGYINDQRDIDIAKRVGTFNDQYGTAFKPGENLMKILERLKKENPIAEYSELYQDILNFQNTAKNEILKMNEESKEGTEDVKKDVDELLEAQNEFITETLAIESRKPLVEAWLNRTAGDDDELRGALRSLAEETVKGRQELEEEIRILSENKSKDFDDAVKKRRQQFDDATRKKTLKIINDFYDEQIKLVHSKLKEELSKYSTILKNSTDNLKTARSELYDQDKAAIDSLIDSEQKRLDRINAQNKAIKNQIIEQNKLRQKEIDHFELVDKEEFAKAVGDVDYMTEIRKGLAAISNDEGIANETYSVKSMLEAAEERLDLAKLEADNMFKLEKFDEDIKLNEKKYLERKQELAAMQARFADEALKLGSYTYRDDEGRLITDEITARDRLELEQMVADAFIEYQELEIQATNNRHDNTIRVFNEEVDANEEKTNKIKATMDSHKSKLKELKTAYDLDMKAIADSVKGATDSNDAMKFSVEKLKDGIMEPLQKIITQYNRLTAAARQAAQASSAEAMASAAYASGQTINVPVFTPGGVVNIPTPAPQFATGGVVPKGFNNDSYPAMLSSNEPVFPAWFGDLLSRAYKLNTSSGSSYNHTRSVNIDMRNSNFNEEGAVRREIREALAESGYGSGSVNGAYFGTTGLN